MLQQESRFALLARKDVPAPQLDVVGIVNNSWHVSSVDKARESLLVTRTSPGTASPPAVPGVYAVFLRDTATLPIGGVSSTGLIYLGTSGNLAQRDIDTHFTSGGSGFSTLRRSLGAILKQQLRLVAIPRGTGPAQTNYRNYRFNDEGEDRLTEWMHSNLEIGWCASADAGALERALIAEMTPALNLTAWPNPEAQHVKALRRACVDEARETRR